MDRALLPMFVARELRLLIGSAASAGCPHNIGFHRKQKNGDSFRPSDLVRASLLRSQPGGFMRSVVFFNNKGGVGKTTLACNIAAQFADQRSLRVLLVDCDPQCNSTQLILETDQWASIYWEKIGDDQQTIIDILQPIELGDADIQCGVSPMKSSQNRFGVDLIPGHPRMSIIEDLLSRAWGEAIGGDIGGIRRTNWIPSLLREYEDRYDVILFDVGPSLGSLNRTILIGADYFVAPMGADIFSVVGIRNIAEWLNNWISVYKTGLSLCTSRHPDALEKFGIDPEGQVNASFVGYTVQQYITKSKQGVRRPTQAFEAILSGIPNEVEQSLGKFTPPDLDMNDLKLGDVPNMYSLIPLAQSVNAPISALQSSDGLAGGQYRQQENYLHTIRAVTESLARNMGS
ncbi:ParA family protein [Rhodococcus sp. NCIMB 12038]|uniref:ParA family protein n=1 Tax=Rhodococcus sp. NCIMB 12038 TaxID=933800 RepID=UPI0015C65ECE|nr:ParA family protein [Rhodococcus sp. NCIMB 12038]